MIQLKFYQNLTSNTVFDTISDLSGLSIEENIKTASTMKCTISLNVEWIKIWQKVEVVEVNDENEDKSLFTGFICSVTPTLDDLQLEAKATKSIMEKKLILSDKTFNNATLEYILSDLLNEWFDTYAERWTVSNSLMWRLNKQFKKWDNLYQIFNEISEALKGVWTIDGTQIIFKDVIWTDRTSWTNFFEVVYDKDEPLDNNLSSLKVRQLWNISNVIFWKNSNSVISRTNQTSITEFWPLAELVVFREWDLATSTQAYVDARSSKQTIYEVDVNTDDDVLSLWDKIKLRIENVSSYININADVLINKKTTTFNSWQKVIKMELSEVYVVNDDFVNKINDTRRITQILQLR